MTSFASNVVMSSRMKDEVALERNNSLEYGTVPGQFPTSGAAKYREENEFRMMRNAASGGHSINTEFRSSVSGQMSNYVGHHHAPQAGTRVRDDFRSSGSGGTATSSSTVSEMGSVGSKDHEFSIRPPHLPFTSASASSIGGGGGGYAQPFWNYGAANTKR